MSYCDTAGHTWRADQKECVQCGAVDEEKRLRTVDTSALQIFATGHLSPSPLNVVSMARELLAVRAERTNEAHKAQLAEAKACIARSLLTQFKAKVYSVKRMTNEVSWYPAEDDITETWMAFFDDLASNAIAGITELIARENESED